MKIIVCVEKSNGMMFNNRRHSKDKNLQDKIFQILGDKKLFVNQYTVTQFNDTSNLIVCDNFFDIADDDSFCFVENTDIPIEKVNEFYIFQWNRAYPSDFNFKYDLNALGYRKIKTENFPGNSHKNITLEVYKKI